MADLGTVEVELHVVLWTPQSRGLSYVEGGVDDAVPMAEQVLAEHWGVA